jgi:hypothetical protein
VDGEKFHLERPPIMFRATQVREMKGIALRSTGKSTFNTIRQRLRDAYTNPPIYTSTHLHIYTSTHLHIYTSTLTHNLTLKPLLSIQSRRRQTSLLNAILPLLRLHHRMRHRNTAILLSNRQHILVVAFPRATPLATIGVLVLAAASAAAVAVVLAEVDCDEGLGELDTMRRLVVA